jgi:hypothetical protein
MGPAVKHYSEAFYGDGPTPTLFYDFVGLHGRLAEDIA